jgi:hypothetical protein
MKKSQIVNLVSLAISLVGIGAALPLVVPNIFVVRSQPNTLANSSATSLTRNFRPDPIRIDGTAGGNVSLTSLGGIEAKCRGFANSQPNHVFELTSNFPRLDILAYTGNVNSDLTMLIKSSNGLVICGDDENQRRNPQISRPLPSGIYQIWVGLSDVNKATGYKLSISESPQK